MGALTDIIASPFARGAGIGLPIAGGIIQARGVRMSTDAAADAANYNAALAELQGRAAGEATRRAGRRATSAEKVAIATSGLRLEGSPLRRLVENAEEREVEAVNFEIAARNTANLERTRARNAKRAGDIGVGTALLSGATQGVGFALGQLGQPRLRLAGRGVGR